MVVFFCAEIFHIEMVDNSIRQFSNSSTLISDRLDISGPSPTEPIFAFEDTLQTIQVKKRHLLLLSLKCNFDDSNRPWSEHSDKVFLNQPGRQALGFSMPQSLECLFQI
jgi:hypothetical protein